MKHDFDPRAELPYPLQTDEHYRPFSNLREMTFDENYPYVDKSFSFRFKRFWIRFLLLTIVLPFSYVRLGLRIEGRKNLKKHKAALKKGAISVSNHVNLWDYISIMNAVRPRRTNVLVLKENIAYKDGNFVKLVGGIPIPENDFKATKAYLKQVMDLLQDGGWLHIYPEGSMWEYYRHIRPFKKGPAILARMADKPIVPLAFSYRKPSKLRKLLFHQPAALTISIGEPLFIDKSIPSCPEQEEDLLKRAHHAVVELAGLSEEENRYEAIWNHSHRIDY